MPVKQYYLMNNIGKVKYTVNFFDGIQKHNDGSDFYEIKCFSNKKERDIFVKSLKIAGYREK